VTASPGPALSMPFIVHCMSGTSYVGIEVECMGYGKKEDPAPQL